MRSHSCCMVDIIVGFTCFFLYIEQRCYRFFLVTIGVKSSNVPKFNCCNASREAETPGAKCGVG